MDCDQSDFQQSQQQQQQQQQPQQQQQQMQCEPSPPDASSLQFNGAIPLPVPPQSNTSQYGAVKNQLQTSSPTDIEIDSLLLQQFSCLGTTDHEDLVKQFQSVMNNQMNEDSARFFLEMSNWNLQTAVGCYLDFRPAHVILKKT